MKAKKIITLAISMMLTTTMVGCSTYAGNKEGSEENVVTVGVWNGNTNEEKALNEVISNFEKESGVKVRKKIYTDFNTQIKTDLIGETAPDVFYLDVNTAPELIDAGVLENLDTYMTDEYDVADVYPSLLSGFKDKEGSIYGIPKDYSSLAVYCNDDLLKEAGYTKEDIPKELEKWPTFLKELQSKLPEGKKAAMIDTTLSRIMGFIEANGIEIVDSEGYSNLNDPKVKEVLQILSDLYENGSTKQAVDLGYGWNGDAFGSEAAAIMIEGSWVVGHLEDNFPKVNYSTLEMPTYNGQKSNILFSVAYTMNSESENKDNAWKFIEYATGKKGMETWSVGSKSLPSRKSVADKIEVTKDPIFKAHTDGAEYGTTWQKGLTLPIIDREFNNWMSAVVLGNMTLEEAMKKATDTANKDINIQLK